MLVRGFANNTLRIRKELHRTLSRRAFLRQMGLAPMVFLPAPMFGKGFLPFSIASDAPLSSITDYRLAPRYPATSPLEDVLRHVQPGTDEFLCEQYAFEIQSIFDRWSRMLRSSRIDLSIVAECLDPAIRASSFGVSHETPVRSGGGVDVTRRIFDVSVTSGRDRFLQSFADYLASLGQLETADFELTALDSTTDAGTAASVEIRYSFVAKLNIGQREERVGYWRAGWSRDISSTWKIRNWQTMEETHSVGPIDAFIDVAPAALSATDTYQRQLLRGADYWRSTLDSACGIDIYGNNGVAAGDFDNDGFDDLYVCQPAGLPNRLYRNRGDGTLEDVTAKAGVGVLDNSACALFADFNNAGLQDLLVVCGSGPLLFLNQGDGTFRLKRDAFRFEQLPQGTFTHAAVADYDRDGRLDIYFCLYNYYVGLDQYHYPIPYFDARNGPPNFLFHNEGNGNFVDKTKASGLNANNNRYSFACAWGSSTGNGAPDLYVVNDFGRNNLYRNNGDGTFTDISAEAHVEDVGAGMSAAWADVANDGRQDLYAANMWSAAGQRISSQKVFHEHTPEEIRSLYRRHSRGNSLYRNRGGSFENVAEPAGAAMGRWSWCSDFWDFDHDGYSDLYIANGYISGPEQQDLSSFFWRQVVGRSPEDATPSLAYERGWNALNELVRSDHTWSGYERNVLFANNRDGTFSEVSGALGLDFREDGRSFALADIDHDGRLELILKNRNAPQLRILRNTMKDIGDSIIFRLRGTKSNRDAIGAAISLETGPLRQTKYLQAGTGFLAQHSKEVLFGIGKEQLLIRATVRWPSGLTQHFDSLPANHRIEITEGSQEFTAKSFATVPKAYLAPAPLQSSDTLPSTIDTWLLQPLKAPEFSLVDLDGRSRELSSFRGAPILLTFWATGAPSSRRQLSQLQQYRAALFTNKLTPLAIKVDEEPNLPSARSLATELSLSFPVLLATPDIAGIYNIIYRYLFDRRRDLPIPSTFLLDADGMIVKLYQGVADPQQLIKDARSIPTTEDERQRHALPFDGVRYQDAFERNDFTYGVALFQHGYLDAAAASFKQVIATKPDNAEAHYNLGTLYLQRNDLQQARQFLETTVRLRPDYPEAWNNLGMIAAQQGRTDDAVHNFEESLRLRPHFPIALVNLGNLYRRLGKTDQALDLLSSALESQPDDAEANYSMGMLYAQQGQTQNAAEYWKKAIALRPAYPEALNNLGVLFVQTRQYSAAEEQFQTCIRLAPEFDASYLNLARLYVVEHNSEGAKQILQQLMRIRPDSRAAQQAAEMLKSLP
jgi:tetratricopeptide (TPR) repeat protein/peroxiredoxin